MSRSVMPSSRRPESAWSTGPKAPASTRSSERRPAPAAWTSVPSTSKRRTRRRPRLAEEGIHELRRVERAQVGHLLAHADVSDRDAELVGDADHDAALGGPVELGERDARDPEGLVELARLGD